VTEGGRGRGVADGRREEGRETGTTREGERDKGDIISCGNER